MQAETELFIWNTLIFYARLSFDPSFDFVILRFIFTQGAFLIAPIGIVNTLAHVYPIAYLYSNKMILVEDWNLNVVNPQLC